MNKFIEEGIKKYNEIETIENFANHLNIAIGAYNLLKTENELMRRALETCKVFQAGGTVEFSFQLQMVNDALAGRKDGVLIRGLEYRREK